MTRTEKSAFWHEHVTAWQSSNQSQQAYCDQHSLKLSAFVYWRGRHKRQRKLLPLAMPAHAQQDRIRIDLPYGVRLDLSATSLPTVLPVVLRALRETA